MIIEFLVSLAVVCLTAVACSFTSGGFVGELVSPTLLAGILLVLAVMVFLSGHGKAFLLIFCPGKKLKSADLGQLKKLDGALSFALEVLFFVSLFFTLLGGIYFYLNIDERQTLGVNVSTVILSAYYFCFFAMILIAIKGKNRLRIITFMAEDDSDDTETPPRTKRHIVLRAMTIFASVAVIVALYVLVIYMNTANRSGEAPISLLYLTDIPSLIFAFVPPLLLLAVSGNFRNFFCALRAAFRGSRLSVSRKSVFVNAVQGMRHIALLCGIMCTLGGYMGMMVHLEDRESLGVVFMVASVPLIYGIFVNLVLLPVESKITRLCDAE